jgi:gliding motility-associated-like protein
MQLYFSYSDIHPTDTLYVFDGPNTSAPLIGAFNNGSNPSLNLLPITADITNASGCLTVRFVSNGSNQATGWQATIDCEIICQDIFAHVDQILTTPHPVDGYIGICPDGTVNFTAYGTYPENNMLYAQSDGNSVFEWNFGDGTTANGPVVSHTYPNSGGYQITLNITDQHGCVSTNSIDTRVVIAGSPYADLIPPPDACVFDTVELLFSFDENPNSTIQGDPFVVSTQTTLGVSDTTYLPDGTGDCYTTSVTFNCFGPGQELEHAWDVLNLCANMEHSFLGDLEISVICPNGQSIILKEFMSAGGTTGQGGGTYLGDPNQADDGVPGIGWDYCWSTTPAMGTMVAESGSYTNLPAGSYTPYESFFGLVGCPLNGMWTIEICDNWGLDDGFIFSWYIELDPDIAPDNWSYAVQIDQMGWTDGPFIIDETDNSLILNPTSSGSFNYTYTIIDEFGCQWDTTAPLLVLTSPIVNLGDDLTFCDNTGSQLLNAGNPGCTYLWQNGSTAQTYNATTSGTYWVEVSNTQCSVTDSIDIVFSGFDFDSSFENVACYNGSDGSIDITVSSLYPPYSYIWSNGAVSQDLINIPAGTYHVTVSDAGSCTITETFEITEPDELEFTSVLTHIDCNGNSNGEISITTFGGVAPYTFAWTNSAISEDINGLSAGTYGLSITDNNNCRVTGSFIITEPTVLTASVSPQHILCFGDTNGAINLTVSGGTPNYTYNWSSGQTSEDISGLTAGNYSVTVSDFNGCDVIASTNINTVSTPLAITLVPTHLLCYGYNNGSINATITGGTPPYYYSWSSGHSSEDITGLVAGNYSLTLTDNNGCVLVENTVVTQPPALVVNISPNQTICVDQTAIVSASTTGGTSPYSYLWNTGSVGSSISVSPIIQTSYLVNVTDANGCTISRNSVVNVYDSLHLDIQLEDYYICKGEPAVITGSFSGGNGGPYMLMLDDEIIALPHSYNTNVSQTFRVCITDMCTSPEVCDDVSVVVMDLPAVAFLPDITAGCEPLSVQFNSWGDDDIVGYNWNFGDQGSYNTSDIQNPFHNYENDGIFSVGLTVTDTGGCKTTVWQNNLINVYPLPEANFLPEPSLVNILNPEVYFNNMSELAFYNYWYFGDGDSSNIFSLLHEFPPVAATYIVELMVETIHGCKDSTTAKIIVEDVYSFYAPTAFTPNNNSVNDKFFVVGEGIDPNNFNMYVYDRWGELIFETDKFNPENPKEFGWDGRVKENKFAPTGVYTWLVKYRDLRGNNNEKAGSVTILR